MPKTNKPTIRQIAAIKNIVEAVKTGEEVNLKEVMIKSGFSEATARNPEKNLTSKSPFQKLWAEVMKEIDWHKHIQELDMMASIEFNQDKDNVLRSKDMLFKLGNKYPSNRISIESEREARDRVLE